MSALFLMYVFVILHIITAAGWFGLALRLSSQARLVSSVDQAAASAVAVETSRSIRLMGLFLILTFVFSLIAFFLGGGFAAYGSAYHTSLLLIVLLIVVQFAVVNPAWKKLHHGVTGARPSDSAAMDSARKRMAAGIGIGHLLWLVLLVLMFWRSLSATV